MNQRYFPHDIDAVTDPKLQNILREKGLEGIGAYWCIVERLYRQDGVLQESDLASIAWTLHLPNEDLLTSIVRDYGLFSVNARTLAVTSKRVNETLAEMKAREEQSRKAGIASGAARRKANTKRTDVQQPFNGSSTDVQHADEQNNNGSSTINKEINKERNNTIREKMKGGIYDPSNPNYAYRDLDEKSRKLREGN